MVKKATATKKQIKHQGLPRTVAAARKHFPKVEVFFDKMSKAEKKKWIQIAAPKGKSNAIALIRPPDGKRIQKKYVATATADPNIFIVCYYNAAGIPNNDCHEVSAAELAAMKPSGK